MTNVIEDTAVWFRTAKPEPTNKDLTTQIGVHFEEVGELLDELSSSDSLVQMYINDARTMLKNLGYALKATEAPIQYNSRVDILDAICDQIVTGVGIAVFSNMDVVDGLNEVNRSNFSKFDSNGNPLLDKDRKIIKGPDYSKADLRSFV